MSLHAIREGLAGGGWNIRATRPYPRAMTLRLALALTLLVACSSSSTPFAPEDARADTAQDAPGDTGATVEDTAGQDVPGDTGSAQDTAPEAAADVPVDSGRDVGADVPVDVRGAPAGAFCWMDRDCASGMCQTNINRCSAPCSRGSDCPAFPSWGCYQIGGPYRCVCNPSEVPRGVCGTSDDDCDGAVDSDAMMCGGTCTRTSRDSLNCGACGVRCPSGRACGDGRCI